MSKLCSWQSDKPKLKQNIDGFVIAETATSLKEKIRPNFFSLASAFGVSVKMALELHSRYRNNYAIYDDQLPVACFVDMIMLAYRREAEADKDIFNFLEEKLTDFSSLQNNFYRNSSSEYDSKLKLIEKENDRFLGEYFASKREKSEDVSLD